MNLLRSIVLSAIKSEPRNISLQLSNSSILNNFREEVTLTGSLTNELGRKVSQGVSVVFIDNLEDGTAAEGVFRLEQLTSNSNSQVSVQYSAGLIEPNQFINLQVLILDENNNPTSITDLKKIFIRTE